MKVRELIQLLSECDPEVYVGFASEDNISDIDFVEVKLEHLSIHGTPYRSGSQVYLREDEPIWEDPENHDIKVVKRNHDSTFVQTKYTDLY